MDQPPPLPLPPDQLPPAPDPSWSMLPAYVALPNYAGFWIRVGAYLIDFCCLLPIYFPILFIAMNRVDPSPSGVTTLSTSDLTVLRGDLLPFALALYAARWTYEFVMIGRWNATIGKFATGLRVRRSDGSPAGWREAAIRPVLELVLGLLGVGLGQLLDSLWMLWDRQKQTLHDKIASTIVVRK